MGPEDIRPVTFGPPNPSIAESVTATRCSTTRFPAVLRSTPNSATVRTRPPPAPRSQRVRPGSYGASRRHGRGVLQVRDAQGLQCARYHMSAEDVAGWIGPEMLQFEEMPADGSDPNIPTGTPAQVSRLWNDSDRTPKQSAKKWTLTSSLGPCGLFRRSKRSTISSF